MADERAQISTLLSRIADGDREALEVLLPKVYGELRALADHHLRRENENHSLQPTELIHEIYVRLLGGTPIEWQNRSHFMAVASKAMRSVLVDHARARNAEKRGGGVKPVTLTDSVPIGEGLAIEFLDLEDALADLENSDGRAVRVVELLYFGGLTAREAAEVLDVSPRTVERDWRFARAWLFDRLSPDATSDADPDSAET
jgi:RNA polymerase sigma factor (TIGR02999 family)